uniref:Uncharacterized protein n=1 Tax=Ananas comosus var. bracteatus TaxID=296719 RepID=A0A6V7NJE2_ANACO|nr:unnamed protein product [Ananas comosus var. bracteatus]
MLSSLVLPSLPSEQVQKLVPYKKVECDLASVFKSAPYSVNTESSRLSPEWHSSGLTHSRIKKPPSKATAIKNHRSPCSDSTLAFRPKKHPYTIQDHPAYIQV